MESYPVVPLFAGVGLLTLLVTYYIVKKSKNYLDVLPTLKQKRTLLLLVGFMFLISLFLIPKLALLENSKNVFTNELQANGTFKFYKAFMNSELDFYEYYNTLGNDEAFAILKVKLPTINTNSTLRKVQNDTSEIHKNIVLITIESLSAEYLKMSGNKEQSTPFLDSLAAESLNYLEKCVQK